MIKINSPENHSATKSQIRGKLGTPTDEPQRSPITSYEEVLTVPQAAQFLHLSQSTIYTYISKRKIPYVKRNGVVWLLKSRLMEWLLEGEKKTFKELST